MYGRTDGVVLFNYFTAGLLVCAFQLLLRKALVLCCSAAPQEGSLSCAVQLFHELAASVLLVLHCSAVPREGSWGCAVQLVHRLAAGLMLFSCSKEGSCVFHSGVPREGSWWCAFQLLNKREAGVFCAV
jgi:hypothetical protein